MCCCELLPHALTFTAYLTARTHLCLEQRPSRCPHGSHRQFQHCAARSHAQCPHHSDPVMCLCCRTTGLSLCASGKARANEASWPGKEEEALKSFTIHEESAGTHVPVSRHFIKRSGVQPQEAQEKHKRTEQNTKSTGSQYFKGSGPFDFFPP